jgi:hypothetical protein
MCAKINGANLSLTLLVEEWDSQHKYGGYLHSSNLCDGGEKRNTTHACTPYLTGHEKRAAPKSNPSPGGLIGLDC